jgi:hypothetical protein
MMGGISAHQLRIDRKTWDGSGKRPYGLCFSYLRPRNDKIARTTTIAPMIQMMLFMLLS